MPSGSSSFARHDAVPLERVLDAAQHWAGDLRAAHAEIVRIGYFGSYARDQYVPGSDFDVLIEVTHAPGRPRDRRDPYLPDAFPVGVELFVYATGELARLRAGGAAFIAAIDREIRWLP